MATYETDTYQDDQARDDHGSGCDVTAHFSFATSGLATPHAFAINDVLRLCKVPKGAKITDYYLFIPVIDGATGSRLDIGLATQGAALFVNSSTAGHAAAVVSPVNNPNGIVANALPLTVTVDDVFAITAEAASTSAGAGGTINGWIRYNMHSGAF